MVALGFQVENIGLRRTGEREIGSSRLYNMCGRFYFFLEKD